MASQIINQATLTYQYGAVTGTAASNIATATLEGPLTVAKSSLSTDYRPGEEITYSLTFTNNGSAALTDIAITDDLGTYTLPGDVDVTPLTYIGPASLYVNGVQASVLTPTVGVRSVTFTVASLAPGATALILYRAQVNDYALRETAATLTNNTAFTADGVSETMTASYTLDTEDYADLRIIKSMTPNPVTDGSLLTYSFVIYNYGNMDATDVVLTDAFDPAPTGLTVTINGDTVPSALYNYTAAGVLTLPGGDTGVSVTVPAATFTQDAATGIVTVSPGIANVSVSGTI